MAKKSKENPIQHEKDYIEFLEKQIKWNKEQKCVDLVKISMLKEKLSKARLILKLLIG